MDFITSETLNSCLQNIIDVLWLGLPLPASIDRPRLHHQLIPDEIQVESSYSKVMGAHVHALL